MSEIKWLVRAGRGGHLIEEFSRGFIAIGWHELGDLRPATSQDEIRDRYNRAYPGERPGRARQNVSMIYKFRFAFEVGQKVVTYDPENREYHIGSITGDYYHDTNEIADEISDYAHLRRVDWLSDRVNRDLLSTSSRNSLGGIQTLFSVNEEVSTELLSHLGAPAALENSEMDDDGLDEIREDTVARAHELIKDKLLKISADEMEQLSAAILRAMGYKTRVMPKGPDRGVDVIASPDGLALEEPRIKVQVKHRPRTSIGSDDIRCFLGGLREGDKALYVSSGGFTREAKYEADRSIIPLTLLALDELADLVVSHYESFDIEGRVLIPLVKVFFPAE
ncbi:MAG: restriction endonuclease [Candidatus Poribacteria bacterium]|nr:restriction endonuclease [Candidatus Poribacteria bacterium]